MQKLSRQVASLVVSFFFTDTYFFTDTDCFCLNRPFLDKNIICKNGNQGIAYYENEIFSVTEMGGNYV